MPGALDKLINAAKAKLTPKTGRIYYTAYAQFFGISPQCNSVYWNFWSLDPFAQALSLDRRQRMNTLANKVNQAIEDAVTRAGSQVVYVNYVRLFPTSGRSRISAHSQALKRFSTPLGRTRANMHVFQG